MRAAAPARARSRATRTSTVADPVAFAATFAGRNLQYGGRARTLRSIVQNQIANQQQFFLLMRSYLALGLVVGVAGIGVIMVRAVRERRRQVGVLARARVPGRAPCVRRSSSSRRSSRSKAC